MPQEPTPVYICSLPGFNNTCIIPVLFMDELPDVGDIKLLYGRTTDRTLWAYSTPTTPEQWGGGGSITTYIRRSDYVLLDHKSYMGIAVTGSLETESVWTIWVTVTNTAGEVVSNIQYTNKKWTERSLL